MRDKVLVAGTKKDAEAVVKILKKAYRTDVFEDAPSILGYISENGKNTAAILASAGFLRENADAIMKALKTCGTEKLIPVIAFGKAEEIEKLGDTDMTDFVYEPFSEKTLLKRVKNSAELLNGRNALKRLKAKVQKDRIKNALTVQNGIVGMFAGIIHMRNTKCGEHTHFVSKFAEIIAEDIMEHCPEYRLTEERVKQISSASILHDIGKVTIPDRVLLKPEKLLPEEFDCMKMHVENGGKLFDATRKIWRKDYADLCHNIILYHHERYDGKGYPCGLAGEDIPIEAQIVALADVYDALISCRIYKNSIEPKKAYEMIMNGECGAFSETMRESLTRTKDKLENLLQ